MKPVCRTIFFFLLLHRSVAQVAPPVFDPPTQRAEFPATEIHQTLTVDGRLDEALWRGAAVADAFVQQNPTQGQPATYRTEVRVLFNQRFLYVGATCFGDYRQRRNLRVQNLRRDFEFDDNDLFGIALDGFLDQRNAVSFQTSPYGSQRDLQVIDGETFNREWDALWFVRTHRTDSCWTAEFAIPWKTLRYPAGADKLGVIFLRNLRQFNENVTLPAVPRLFTAYRMAYEGLLTGLRPPRPSANVQANPYLVYDATRTQSGTDAPVQTARPKLGGELKWAVSPNTVLDLTLNTDFAQADADRQVVNLTRFSVLFPERRQFFLEGANLFNATLNEFIQPFFSRRIGLDDAGNLLPLDAGLRLTHQDPKRSFGALLVRERATARSPRTHFGVGRFSRNFGEQSRVGGMVTFRQDDAFRLDGLAFGVNQNYTATVDGLLRPSQRTTVGFMASGSRDTRLGDGLAAQAQVTYQTNLVTLSLLQFLVKNYQPGVGIERFGRDYVFTGPLVEFDVRPKWFPKWLRTYEPDASAFAFHDPTTGRLISFESRVAPLDLTLQSGANLEVSFEPNVQVLDEPFDFVGSTVPAGRYRFVRTNLGYNTDFSKKIAASANLATGAYYDGRLNAWTFEGRLAPVPHAEFSVQYEFNRFGNLGERRRNFDTHLLGLNARLALNPRVQLIGFYQRNTAVNRDVYNVRLSWEYRPLSYLFVVLNSNQRDLRNPANRLRQDQAIAKLTYLKQF